MLCARYLADVDAGKITFDEEQLRVLGKLERLASDLLAGVATPSLLQRLATLFGRTAPAPQGVYLWGGVGRGKTFLMDLFYDSLPAVPRREAPHALLGRAAPAPKCGDVVEVHGRG